MSRRSVFIGCADVDSDEIDELVDSCVRQLALLPKDPKHPKVRVTIELVDKDDDV